MAIYRQREKGGRMGRHKDKLEGICKQGKSQKVSKRESDRGERGL